MNNRIRNITVLITLLLSNVSSVLAAGLTSRETNLSKPVGGNILPGGNAQLTEDISTSFVFSKLIPFAIKYTIRLAVALSVIAVMIGGFQFMTAYGDTEKRQVAQRTITYAVIGLVLSITAFAIVELITRISFT